MISRKEKYDKPFGVDYLCAYIGLIIFRISAAVGVTKLPFI
jgi:hypothetical protein